MASNSGMNLHHSTTSVPRDAIIMSSNIRKGCVCCHIFIPKRDIGSWEPGFVVVTHRKPSRCTKPLGNILKSGFDMVSSGPTKKGRRESKLGFLGRIELGGFTAPVKTD